MLQSLVPQLSDYFQQIVFIIHDFLIINKIHDKIKSIIDKTSSSIILASDIANTKNFYRTKIIHNYSYVIFLKYQLYINDAYTNFISYN